MGGGTGSKALIVATNFVYLVSFLFVATVVIGFVAAGWHLSFWFIFAAVNLVCDRNDQTILPVLHSRRVKARRRSQAIESTAEPLEARKLALRDEIERLNKLATDTNALAIEHLAIPGLEGSHAALTAAAAANLVDLQLAKDELAELEAQEPPAGLAQLAPTMDYVEKTPKPPGGSAGVGRLLGGTPTSPQLDPDKEWPADPEKTVRECSNCQECNVETRAHHLGQAAKALNARLDYEGAPLAERVERKKPVFEAMVKNARPLRTPRENCRVCMSKGWVLESRDSHGRIPARIEKRVECPTCENKSAEQHRRAAHNIATREVQYDRTRRCSFCGSALLNLESRVDGENGGRPVSWLQYQCNRCAGHLAIRVNDGDMDDVAAVPDEHTHLWVKRDTRPHTRPVRHFEAADAEPGTARIRTHAPGELKRPMAWAKDSGHKPVPEPYVPSREELDLWADSLEYSMEQVRQGLELNDLRPSLRDSLQRRLT